MLEVEALALEQPDPRAPVHAPLVGCMPVHRDPIGRQVRVGLLDDGREGTVEDGQRLLAEGEQLLVGRLRLSHAVIE